MNRMRATNRAEAFEQALLAHVEMCYSVALTLTRNSVSAEELTREVLTWAWQLPESAKDPIGIKPMLLKEMRETYLRTRHQTKHATEALAALV